VVSGNEAVEGRKIVTITVLGRISAEHSTERIGYVSRALHSAEPAAHSIDTTDEARERESYVVNRI